MIFSSWTMRGRLYFTISSCCALSSLSNCSISSSSLTWRGTFPILLLCDQVSGCQHLHHLAHLPLAQDIVGSLPHTSPSLAVPRSPGPGNQGEVGDEYGDGGVPEQLVVDHDGVDKVEGEEPEEETRYPAGELRMIFDLMQKKEIRKWCLPATVPRRWRWRWGPPA